MTFFQLTDEYVIDIHRVSWPDVEATQDIDSKSVSNNNSTKTTAKTTAQNYVENRKMYERNNEADEIDDRRIMQCDFPKIEMDKCLVVTNKNLYMIDIK